MLKRLKPRHMDIIRRLLVGQTEGEICLELGLSESYLSILKNDPTFAAKLEMEGERLHERFIEQRMDAMEMIEEVQCEMVQKVITVARTGSIGHRQVSPKDQLNSVWDLLDRGGTKKAEKHLNLNVDIADLVAQAYKEKHQQKNEVNGAADPDAERETSNSCPTGGSIGEASALLMLPPPR